MKERELKSQGSTEESAMNAMEWLARQLVWEHRLVELRELRPTVVSAHVSAHVPDGERKAA